MTEEEAINIFNRLSGMAYKNAIPERAKKDIEELYRFCFKKPIRHCNCKSIHSDALIEIIIFFRRTGKMTDNRKYKLKRGVVIQMPGTTEVYTFVNITDAVAKKYLKKYPQKTSLFEALPEEKPEEPKAKDKEAKEAKKENE